MALAVIQKLRELIMRQSGKLTKYSAQIALLQIDSYWAGTFLPFLAKVDYPRQAFVTVMREQF